MYRQPSREEKHTEIGDWGRGIEVKRDGKGRMERAPRERNRRVKRTSQLENLGIEKQKYR